MTNLKTMKNRLTQTLIMVLLALFPFLSFSQNDSVPETVNQKYIIITSDGGEHIGTIISDDGREIKLNTDKKGIIFIPKYTIKTMEKVNDNNVLNGEYLFENPHASRYFYTPTGFALKKGTGYVQTIWGFYYHLQYGITDNFSLGVATTFIGMPITITPKYTFDLKDNLKLAIGAQVGALTWLSMEENPLLGIGYASITSGTKENNVTLGAGYSFINIDGETFNGVAISAGGTARLAKKISLIGEFWMLPESKVVFGGPGVRIMRKEDNAIDFGFWVVGFDGEVVPVPIPVVSFTWGL